MKKIISIAILFTLALSGCGNDKWNRENPDMPEQLKESHQEKLKENLEILENDSQNTNAQFEVAFRYHQLGDYKNAVEYYEKVLENSPDDYSALTNIVVVYEEVEEYEQAAKYVKDLYSNYPSKMEVIKDAVRILLKADMPGSAKEALENFVRETREKSTPEIQVLISKLYESILFYNQNHEN